MQAQQHSLFALIVAAASLPARRHGISKATAKRLRAVLREFGVVKGEPNGGQPWRV